MMSSDGQEQVPDYVSGPKEMAPPQVAPLQAAQSQPAPQENLDAGGEVDDAPWLQGTGVGQDMGDPNRVAGSGGGSRFWMPKGESKTIIFLTDGHGEEGPPTVFEHNPPLGQGPKRWQNWVSCIEPMKIRCPLCEWADSHDGQARRYKGMFFTVIDTSEFTDKSGVKRSNLKKLLVAKKDTAETIARKYLTRVEAGERLLGAMFKVHRGSGDKSPSVGDDFEFIKMVDLSALPDSEQFDYRKLLEPTLAKVQSAVERLQLELGGAAPQGQAPPTGAGSSVQY
jgi:hypothetical protein